jgi:hypothetical protein
MAGIRLRPGVYVREEEESVLILTGEPIILEVPDYIRHIYAQSINEDIPKEKPKSDLDQWLQRIGYEK